MADFWDTLSRYSIIKRRHSKLNQSAMPRYFFTWQTPVPPSRRPSCRMNKLWCCTVLPCSHCSHTYRTNYINYYARTLKFIKNIIFFKVNLFTFIINTYVVLTPKKALGSSGRLLFKSPQNFTRKKASRGPLSNSSLKPPDFSGNLSWIWRMSTG